MAKKYSSRPAASRAAPDDAAPDTAAPARVTRSTRSQSREPGDVGASTSGSAGGGKAKGGRKGKDVRGGGGGAVAGADLQTVDEGPSLGDQLQQEVNTAEDSDGNRHVRHESVFSTKSATTAKTSFSIEEVSEMDPDIMIDVMPSLATAAEELIKLLIPADPKARMPVWKEICKGGTKHNKLYNNRVSSIGIHKGNFGSEDYIQPSFVLRALLGVQAFSDIPEGPWRPDSVIFKVNLATMLRMVILGMDNHLPIDDEAERGMEELDRHFGSGIAAPQFDQNALFLCLSIVRQLCITKALAHPDGNPSQMSRETFFTQDQNVLNFRHFRVLHMMNLSPEELAEYNMLIQNSAGEFIDAFSHHDRQAALDGLRAKYPWNAFVNQVIEYSLARKQELDSQIAAAGGIEQIKSALEDEVERHGNKRAAEGLRASFSRPGGTPQKKFGKGGIKALKVREKQLASSAAAALAAEASVAPVTSMTDPALSHQAAPVDDVWHPIEEEADQVLHATEPPRPTNTNSILPALSALQQTQRQNAAKGKGRLLDRQEGAHKVQWDDEFGSQTQQTAGLTEYAVPPTFQYPTSSAQGGPYYHSPRRPSNKRPHTEMEAEPSSFDPTQDEGFQDDIRDTTAADERRRLAPQPTTRSPRSRFSAIAHNAPEPAQPASAQEIPKIERRNPGSSIPPSQRPFHPEDEIEITNNIDFKRAKIEARHAAVRANEQRPAQVRIPWSDEEEMALINLIGRQSAEGVSYSGIKSYDNERDGGPLLGRRSAEDMRFKARNMKATFLLARAELPPNFRFIVLDKKAIDKLHRQGIQYYQERIRGGNILDGGE